MSPSIQLTFDLTKGNWSRFGISWFTKQLFFMGQGPEELNSALEGWYAEAIATLKASSVLSELDLNDDTQLAEAHSRIKKIEKKDGSPEYWAMFMYDCIPDVQEAISRNDAQGAALRMAAVASARSMLIFLQLFEETVWRGHTVAKLERTLKTWTDNRDNPNEDFWYEQLSENSFVLSQIFSFPVVILKGQDAYLGGKSIDNTGGNLADFLLKNNLSQNTALVEIKTPKTSLLGTGYRQVYSISKDLSGAIVQISSYKDSFLKYYAHLKMERPDFGVAFNPRCLVIAGTLSEEIADHPTKREAFELFRNGLRDVQVITYDELFEQIKILLDHFRGDAT